MILTYAEDEIREQLKGYHFEVSFFPSGGMLDVAGCEECKTDEKEFYSKVWKLKKGQTLQWTVNQINKEIAQKEL